MKCLNQVKTASYQQSEKDLPLIPSLRRGNGVVNNLLQSSSAY